MRYKPQGFGVIDPTTRKGATFGRDPNALRDAWVARVARIADAYNKPLGYEMARELYEAQFGKK